MNNNNNDDILTELRRIELEKERQDHAQKMSLQLSKSKRREFVMRRFIDRYTVEQTRDYIYQTNTSIITWTIDRDRDYIKSEASKFFYVLAKDNNDEYNLKLKTSVDSMKQTLSSLKKMFNEPSNVAERAKIAEVFVKIWDSSLWIL